MFSRVLIGVDGAEGGRDAIALAAQLADQDATTWLVHVVGAGLMPGRGSALLLSAELEQARRLLAREREAAAPAAELIPCADRSVGHALHVLGERHNADLIVTGASRHGFLGRVLLGDDASAALNDAPCAVAIAPMGYAERARRFAVLGVGYDGSPHSEQAFAIARGLAGRLQANIRALSVSPPQSASGDDVDLLIVGSGGHQPRGRLLHGSTSNQLARRASYPLLVLQSDVAGEQQRPSDLPLELAMSDASWSR